MAIQIQRPQQFERAVERLRTERQFVQRYEKNFYRVTNRAKNHTYYVRIESKHGRLFGTCGCEAGTPSRAGAWPVVCKHLCAVVLYLRAIQTMRRVPASH
ncbi:MAG: hypothetical protein ACJ74Q_10455 [Pyrinomonadaceae bacterium]